MAFKTVFTDSLQKMKPDDVIDFDGWIQSKRVSGQVVFLDLVDSHGKIQVVVEKNVVGVEAFKKCKQTPPESNIKIRGTLRRYKEGDPLELAAMSYDVISEATLQLTPRPREQFDIFSPRFTDEVIDKKHLYIRNPKYIAILKYRARLMRSVRDWFHENGYTEFDAPIITPAPLYDDRTAMGIDVKGQSKFLSQCAGFYLEAAAQALEKVFNMGPSFRGEESRSLRHLMEYWHIKAEVASGNLDDIMGAVEDLLAHIAHMTEHECQDIFDVLHKEPCLDGNAGPFPRIDYADAITLLHSEGHKDAKYGESLSSSEEATLSRYFRSAVWVTLNHRDVEPFPYVIDSANPERTRVADLIASREMGELLGAAEKIHDPVMLDERLKDKGKLRDPRYEFVRQVHAAGCVPHTAFGMGLERLMRWMLDIPHVRDAIPFPRIPARIISV